MNKLWNKIWFNLVIDLAIILLTCLFIVIAVPIHAIYSGRANAIDKLLFGLIIVLTLHALFILVLSIVNLINKYVFRGILYFFQFILLLLILRHVSFASRGELTMGIYIKEGAVDKDARFNSDTIANTAKGEHLNDSLKFVADLKEMLRNHTDSVISISYVGGKYEVDYLKNINWNNKDSVIDANYLQPIVWNSSYSLTLKKKMITSGNIKEGAKIINDNVTDTIYDYYLPVFSIAQDSSVKAEPLPGHIFEIEHYSYNKDTIWLYSKAFNGKVIGKITKPGHVLKTDIFLSARNSDCEESEWAHIVSKNRKKGYWVEISHTMLSHEFADSIGPYTNAYFRIFLKEIKK